MVDLSGRKFANVYTHNKLSSKTKVWNPASPTKHRLISRNGGTCPPFFASCSSVFDPTALLLYSWSYCTPTDPYYTYRLSPPAALNSLLDSHAVCCQSRFYIHASHILDIYIESKQDRPLFQIFHATVLKGSAVLKKAPAVLMESNA